MWTDGRRSEHANGMSIVSKPKAVAGRTGAKHGGASSRPNTRTMAARAGAGGRQLSGSKCSMTVVAVVAVVGVVAVVAVANSD